MQRPNALIPELAVSDWRASLEFYCHRLGFSVVYRRPDEGFALLELGKAQLMIDQIGQGRTFDFNDAPREYPFGRGLNIQLRVPSVDAILANLHANGIALYLPLEERWYRRHGLELGLRQFVVPDPDGYLLRLFEPLGERRIPD